MSTIKHGSTTTLFLSALCGFHFFSLWAGGKAEADFLSSEAGGENVEGLPHLCHKKPEKIKTCGKDHALRIHKGPTEVQQSNSSLTLASLLSRSHCAGFSIDTR